MAWEVLLVLYKPLQAVTSGGTSGSSPVHGCRLVGSYVWEPTNHTLNERLVEPVGCSMMF